MITILPAPSHVAAFVAEDTLRAEDYERCIEVIEQRLTEHPRIALYIDMRDMDGMTPAAIGKDLAYAVRKFGDYHRFARGAVVTDAEWLDGMVRFFGALPPRTELRTFPGSEREAALAWAGEPILPES